MNKLLLQTVFWLNPLWRRLGVDPQHLYIILESKLKMDGRRKGALGHLQANRDKELKGQDVLAMVMFTLLGLLFMMFLLAIEHRPSGIFVFISLFMAFLAMTLISDFTDVLIDVRDNYILLPRPIVSATLGVARLLHVLFYLLKMVLPLSLPALIYVLVRVGPVSGLVFAILVALATILTILIVNLFYLVLLQFNSAQRFKEIINYFQILFFAATFISYQLLPRLVADNLDASINLLTLPGLWWAPSLWLGALWAVVLEGAQERYLLVLGILGLIAPALALVAVVRLFNQDFFGKLLAIGEGGEGRPQSSPTRTSQSRSWMARTARWVGRSTVERAAYEWSWLLTRRSRDFKLKFYPNLIMLPTYFAFVLFQGGGTFSERIGYLRETPAFAFGVLYFASFLIMAGSSVMLYSDKYRASWIFLATPVKQPGALLTGTFKMILVRFFAPVYLILSLLMLGIVGPSLLPDLALALVNNILMTLISAALTVNSLPFSKPWEDQAKGGNLALAFLTMILSIFVGGLHFAANWYFPWGIYVLIPISMSLVYFIDRYYYQLSWRNINLS